MTAHLIPCSCCGDETDETKAYVDPDLQTPVCPECKTNLRWAQAYLQKPETGIKGCVKEGQ